MTRTLFRDQAPHARVEPVKLTRRTLGWATSASTLRAASAGAFVTKFTVPGGDPVSCIASTMRPWVPPCGTAPFEHMQQVFAGHGLGLPNIVVEPDRLPC